MEEEKAQKIPLFLAHVDSKTQRTQALDEHLNYVGELCKRNCPLQILEHMAQVCALLHDAGKLGPFQDYMREILEQGERAGRKQLDHSSAGGRLAEDMTGGAFVSKIVGTVIYSHHGLQDCIDMESGETLSEKRRGKELDFETVRKRYFQLYEEEKLRSLLQKAHKDAQELWKGIQTVTKRFQEKDQYGNSDFFLGMYERLLLSLLIDSDWSDAADFSNGGLLPEGIWESERGDIWNLLIPHFEDYMRHVSGKSQSSLNRYRNQIAAMCYEAAQTGERRYRLTVPTGAGKTLAGLGFALYHAQKHRKKRIFYVAPFNSLLEQNAEEIRRAVGGGEYILEHHCNVICEDAEEEENYKRLTESYDVPIVATTAVQILNILFSGQKSSLRRMHRLCGSIMIFDEVQALPARCTELFHLAVNFLSEFCNTTVVLCSATQPSLAKMKENNILGCREMAGDPAGYQEVFRRVEIEDATRLVPGGMQISDLQSFVFKQYEVYKRILVILNTKAAALEMYRKLEAAAEEDCCLYHLSTNMCPQNRKEELEAIKKSLCEGKKVICVSTQVVEAGIDFSFGCVIRSLAGLDSIIQAAGRCNRHKELGDRSGKVYIVKMAADVEKISRMPEMKKALESCGRLLDEFQGEPEEFEQRLDSQKAVKRYYQLYYRNLGGAFTKYPAMGGRTSLVELLGRNEPGISQYLRRHREGKIKYPLNQAFATAGKEFQAIAEEEKVSVIVPYDRKAKEELERFACSRDISGKKSALRKLQRYGVGISAYRRRELEYAIDGINYPGLLVLREDCYDRKTGVLERPKNSFLNM